MQQHQNRLELNDNGSYVVDLARKVVSDADALVTLSRQFDQKKKTIRLGSCAPAPLWTIVPLILQHYPQMTLQTTTDDGDNLSEKLLEDEYQLIITHQKIDDPRLSSRHCGRETLMFALPKGHRFARRKSLSLAEMNGENMLLMSDIGFWHFIRTQKMPDSRFLIQNDRFSFNELVEASSLAAFTSDLADRTIPVAKDRIRVPVSDPEAVADYYLICRREHRSRYAALFSSL